MFFDLLQVLCRIGFIRRDMYTRRVVWPISIAPWHMWVTLFWHGGKRPWARIGLFRNLPHVQKWIPGRLLPARWGFFILGFEVGDRGGGPRLIL